MNIGTQQISAFFASQKTKTIAISVITIIVITAIIWLVMELTGTSSKLKDKFAQKKLNELLDGEINEQATTLNEASVKALADKLYTAMEGWGTDEDAIYEVMNDMNTRSDVILLIKTFGVRDGKNLVQWITSELNAKERAQVNNILRTNNVNYEF